MDKKVQAALLFVLAVFIFMAGSKYGNFVFQKENTSEELIVVNQEQFKEDEEVKKSKSKTEDAPIEEIYVHVAGAVKKPGLYKVTTKSRVDDAVSLAQPLAEADINMLNLAEKLYDGQKIIVPAQGETITQLTVTNTPSSQKGASGLVNINTATAQELDTLPGIGPAYADRIIQYRTENGPFQKIDDIQQVQGIGPKKYDDIKERITVN